jgi:glutathione S-transferase
MTYTLIIGDKAYSSWSLRGWLLFDAFGIPVEERLVRLYSEELDAYRRDVAPARTVPALRIEEGGERLLLWDSLAIAETLAERHPDAGIWPEAPGARAAARSLAAEMHSGFSNLRGDLPMNTRRRGAASALRPEVRSEFDRLQLLWSWARGEWGGDGPYLFGRFSAADAFFAPVAFRVRAYDVPLSKNGAAYMAALLDHASVRRWEAAAEADPRFVQLYEDA